MTDDPDAPGEVVIHHGDNLEVARGLASGAFTLIYLDPPFNTGRAQRRAVEKAVWHVADPDAAPTSATPRPRVGDGGNGPDHASGAPIGPSTRPADAVIRRGFHGREYERLRGDLRAYDDRFDDYWGWLEPRLLEAWRLLADDGTLYLHLDYREAHYAKVLMDALFGRDRFLNELIWAYDYGAKSRRRWPTKHDTILVYVKNPATYWFDSTAVDREPYMAPGLVTAEKAARGKLPTDVWWHTIVPTTGREKTGYPTQKPEGILRRIVQASSRPGDRVLDLFAGSGTTGAVASMLGRDAVLVDANPDAVSVMTARIPHAEVSRGSGPTQGETPTEVAP
ncbi:site-specific DNA-methyltransferase [Microbacterium aquimaris]|uniref:DNA-methyltransferase n=1 Tax=Microbacterium aquimaris TaxID=459816 RepID=UPI002AD2B825|nr:site-specific DNA-methyltransferase [Microbacterium aquimaris]MDZ8275025.1 site-specific DNA-methyltransferase [Microbacterium aquimaris]